MLYDVIASLLHLNNICVFDQLVRDWEYLEELLNCARMEKVQAAFPTIVSGKKRRQQEPRPLKDRLQVVLEECKAMLTALCKQYCEEQGWQPPLGMVYEKVHKPVRRKVDHPSAKIWDADDLSSGDESHSEGPPMGSRSL